MQQTYVVILPKTGTIWGAYTIGADAPVKPYHRGEIMRVGPDQRKCRTLEPMATRMYLVKHLHSTPEENRLEAGVYGPLQDLAEHSQGRMPLAPNP